MCYCEILIGRIVTFAFKMLYTRQKKKHNNRSLQCKLAFFGVKKIPVALLVKFQKSVSSECDIPLLEYRH